MSDSFFLQAFDGTNQRIPVWFMRQAGRFLTGYQRIRDRYTLTEMFKKPELISELTCMPVKELGVDAAILFADILSLPAAMGCDIDFVKGDGPVITHPIQTAEDVGRIHDFEKLSYLTKAIKAIHNNLPAHVPLIGFAGSPFTVLCYLIEGGSSVNFTKTFRFIHDHPQAFGELMGVLTQNTIGYLQLQQASGIKVFQLFDTWAGLLRPSDYAHWVLPYVQEIFKKVDLPSIYYVKNCRHLLELMLKTKADFLSVCQTVVLGHSRLLENAEPGVQGNLFNGLLYADFKTLEKEINDVLLGARYYRRYIFNLSHGIFPDVEIEKVKFVVKKVHDFKWK